MISRKMFGFLGFAISLIGAVRDFVASAFDRGFSAIMSVFAPDASRAFREGHGGLTMAAAGAPFEPALQQSMRYEAGFFRRSKSRGG